MKKIILALIMIFCMGLLSACAQKTDADVSTVFIEKKGSVVSLDVENLDRDYYSEEELESYITEHIEEYTGEHGDTVEKLSFDVEGETAKLKMEYDSCEDYAGFNGIEFYHGTVVKAQAQGYDFDTEFYSVKDGEKQKDAAKKDVLADDDANVAIIKANINVKVPGSILFVSSKDTKLEGKDTVSITGKGSNEEAALTYIIYK